MNKKILLLLGGSWHDFEGFAQAMRGLGGPAGYVVETTYDLDRLRRLASDPCDVVLSYTCMSPGADGVATQPQMTDEQVQALAGWVRAGGALLGAHAATVLGQSSPALGALLGGTFVSHPKQHTFAVYPLSRPHPITAGLAAFKVKDELYIQTYEPNVEVHLAALYEGVAHPMAWSKSEGAGRVAYVALGHSQAVWKVPAYQRLMLQTLAWVTRLPTNPVGS